ncbi:hypothetical protein MWH25_01420 [Natroniella acetigena]|uniref:hypothetical protein n=1 Tax=Natroniella acetigena TaxID=52004 RepID=UPI00200ABAAA|nr:hypothetical protein [Natroniella acetigena]MCK8826407.1 hypothetical protein [Natroniella acetigena]
MLAPTFYSIFSEDQELTDLLADYEISEGVTVPAIFQDWGQRSNFPYMIFKLRSVPDNHWNKEKYYLEIDIFDYSEGGSTVKAKQIARRLKILLHRLRINEADGYSSIRVEHDTGDLVQEEEENIIHYETIFEVWAWDSQFVEESENV